MGWRPPADTPSIWRCPSPAYAVRGDWPEQAEAFVDAMVDQVEQDASGFRDSILARTIRTPTLIAEGKGLLHELTTKH
jgi:phytoene dehydrogenase-like protein